MSLNVRSATVTQGTARADDKFKVPARTMPEVNVSCDNFQPAPGTANADAWSITANAPLRVRHDASLADIARDDWTRLFPGRAEYWGYFRACELAGPQGFATSAIAAYADDSLVAAAPLFRTDFRLDMSLEGPDLAALGSAARYLDAGAAP